MKRCVGLFATMLALTACDRADRNAPESYQHWDDRMIARLGLPNVGIWPCKTDEPTEDCFKVEAPQRWRGVWALGPGEHMEWFCPNTETACSWEKRPKFELEWNRRVFTGRPQVQAEWGKRYLVDFVGRRTTYKSGYWDKDYTIVVDRLISMKEVPISEK